MDNEECIFYDKEPKETPYCYYLLNYLSNGCIENCEYNKTPRQMLKEYLDLKQENHFLKEMCKFYHGELND